MAGPADKTAGGDGAHGFETGGGKVNQSLKLQGGATLVCMAGALASGQGGQAVAASLWGGGMALLGTLMLQRRLRQAEAAVVGGAGRGAEMPLYRGAVERFVLAGALFGVAFGLLHLSPPWVLGSFAAAQAAHWLGGVLGTIEGLLNSGGKPPPARNSAPGDTP
ncbi:MAG: ATP synthase subunit I [Magnetococcus sp. WYHC-3]